MKKNIKQPNQVYSPLPKRPRQYAQEITGRPVSEWKELLNAVPLEMRKIVRHYLLIHYMRFALDKQNTSQD